MKPTILIFLTLVATLFISNAQNRAIIQTKLKLQDDDSFLSWITTSKDILDQDKKTENEIDNETDRIVQSQKNKSMLEIEVPINFKKLIYNGIEDIRKLVLFSLNIFAGDPGNNYKDAENKHIYQFGNLFSA